MPKFVLALCLSLFERYMRARGGGMVLKLIWSDLTKLLWMQSSENYFSQHVGFPKLVWPISTKNGDFNWTLRRVQESLRMNTDLKAVFKTKIISGRSCSSWNSLAKVIEGFFCFFVARQENQKNPYVPQQKNTEHIRNMFPGNNPLFFSFPVSSCFFTRPNQRPRLMRSQIIQTSRVRGLPLGQRMAVLIEGRLGVGLWSWGSWGFQGFLWFSWENGCVFCVFSCFLGILKGLIVFYHSFPNLGLPFWWCFLPWALLPLQPTSFQCLFLFQTVVSQGRHPSGSVEPLLLACCSCAYRWGRCDLADDLPGRLFKSSTFKHVFEFKKNFGSKWRTKPGGEKGAKIRFSAFCKRLAQVMRNSFCVIEISPYYALCTDFRRCFFLVWTHSS